MLYGVALPNSSHMGKVNGAESDGACAVAGEPQRPLLIGHESKLRTLSLCSWRCFNAWNREIEWWATLPVEPIERIPLGERIHYLDNSHNFCCSLPRCFICHKALHGREIQPG